MTVNLRAIAVALPLEIVDPVSPAAQQAMGRYFAELDRRFSGGFDAGAQSTKDAELLSPPNGAFVVAVSDGRPVACGGVQTIGDGVGEVKRMWVDDEWRGAGLGSRMLRHLESLSAGLGHRFVRLDTNDSLTEAIAMYERAGYHQVEPYNDNPYARFWFEKELG